MGKKLARPRLGTARSRLWAASTLPLRGAERKQCHLGEVARIGGREVARRSRSARVLGPRTPPLKFVIEQLSRFLELFEGAI